jgi:hypothetical protein
MSNLKSMKRYRSAAKQYSKNLSRVEWHIRNNFKPDYSEEAVKGMLFAIGCYLRGTWTLDHTLTPETKVTVGDLLTDLRLTPEEIIDFTT